MNTKIEHQLNKYFRIFKKSLVEFNSRGGSRVFISSVVAKFSGFILSVIIVRLLTKESFASITYAKSIILVLTPFLGLGAYNSILYFAGKEKNEKSKIDIIKSSLALGSIINLLLFIVLISLSGILTKNIPQAKTIFIIFSILVVTEFPFLMLQSYYRILMKNIKYAKFTFWYSMLLLVATSVAATIYGAEGYSIAFILSPLILVLLFYKDLKNILDFNLKIKKNYLPKGFWAYGLHVSFGAIASQLLVQVDIIMLSNMINNVEDVAFYRVATIIPYQIMFIPNIYMNSDFVYIAKNSENKSFLINYYKKYLSIFGIITTSLALIFILFSSEIISLLYGNSYASASKIFIVFIPVIIIAFLIRSPLGNMLAAVGKSKWNSYNAYATLLLNISLNYYLINIYGVIGAAYGTVLSMLFGCLISIILFKKYLSNLEVKKE